MFFLFRIAVSLMIMLYALQPAQAYAQKKYDRYDPLTKGQANQFYDDCMAQSYPAKSTETKKLFCACSSARFYEQFRQGDLKDLEFPETWQAKKVKEKLLDYVYTPCIKPFVYDLFSEECANNTYLEGLVVNKPEFCLCQNKRMEMTFEQNFAVITRQNKKDIEKSLADPISSFLKNDIFVEKSREVTAICLDRGKYVPPPPEKPISEFEPPILDHNPKAYNEDNHDH
ncbi:MAG: hypothetical protein H6855_04180 [Rhodospirillales bacterium]|nr:hypothetical protein [Rhodospirillales bacterium]MCB9965261.1 hypothetical protein [Rhodospirillales bacterium]MCB9972969.1 hypothetical protein [Rhodospirillales bacterium]MCB9980043.1 hypothetical protein [Rhodospirillales bacterium]